MLNKMLRLSMAGAFALLAATATPSSATAADFEVQTVFEDALYGGAIGALIGGGAMLVSSQPSKHWDYITTGAGIGIIAGAIYGVYSSSRSFAEIEDGKMMVGIPTPQIRVRNYDDSTAVALQADLLKVHY